ncbi:bifunctional aspartate kinase/homoserine dehydrogenase II [Rheinheimera aquimaris]|uniref:homoserine dehydrogenase n=1 Tax=Rheinheimera aquimaris TaxID=412437 RepID=A0ABP3NW44_9GAMM|nr:bifunctional aspartate kinase/homoserine dehydrogenase II [Rheinheimera aquimaris]MCB5214259.1 bifunctional aspartate kinase/homoserine dehydrogenase II [Rheinheimera aquimaris]
MLKNATQTQLNTTQVHKFGGSSLASAARFSAVADIIQQQDPQHQLWVVVSAPGDTTDTLLHIIACADDTVSRDQALTALQKQLQQLITAALPAADATEVSVKLKHWLAEVPDALTQKRFNDVLAIGELVSTTLLSAILRQRQLSATALDARDFLRLKRHQPDLTQSTALLSTLTLPGHIHVVTGYIARDEKGRSITLGRNGSDYSATLVGALVNATEVTIWTDVKAIYSADPRKVVAAIPYQQVSWHQACQLAQLGNPVLHARTLAPLSGTQTALRVRSSYEPQLPGCRVVQQVAGRQSFITELNDVTLLTLHSDIALSAERLALELQQPVISLPQQGDNLCWLLPTACAEQALACLADADIHAVWDTQRYCALAWLKGADPVLPAQADSVLQPHAVLHRYENEQQVIWLLARPLSSDVLQQVHQQLIPHTPSLRVVVAGTGNVGTEFLSMLMVQQKRLSTKVQLQLAGVLNSRQALLADNLDISQWQLLLAQSDSCCPQQLSAYLTALPEPKVLVDITPSQAFARLYPDFIAAGCDIISANKQGVTLPETEYLQIKRAGQFHNKQWLTNTTCGAGIPVQRTLQELISAGDNITEVSGIFSGTLSWLLCQFDGSKPFSDFVLDARQAGLTEPDPRDDLSGKDVQRKLLVLARELGISLELDDIRLQPLLPVGLENGSWQDFWARRSLLDAELAQLLTQAKAGGKVLRYVACLSIRNGSVRADVSLQQVSAGHALAAIAPCDNVFVIRSDWYNDNPLVLKGPGAGKVVTAGGLHTDLAVLVNQLTGKTKLPAVLT